MSRRNEARGFTLIEVLVALLIGAMVLTGARALIEALADQAYRITRSVAERNLNANADFALRSLFDQLEVGTSQAQPFAGDERQMRFSTWCPQPGGWEERCVLSMRLVRDSAGVRVEWQTTGNAVTRWRYGRSVSFQYLESAADGARWSRMWGTRVTAPVAVGIVIDSGMQVFRIGTRG